MVSGLPVGDGAVELVVGFGVAPVVADLVGHQVFVQLDAEAWEGWQFEVAVGDLEGVLQVALAQGDLFLDQEVRDAGGDLQSGGQGDGA